MSNGEYENTGLPTKDATLKMIVRYYKTYFYIDGSPYL